MAYQVLARKWRPQDFASLVGQETIVTALRNALAEGRIAQAYVFSGIRGVGKTTAARLLAKALNCEQGPTATPCNACVACREITAGSDIDVVEVDAATHSKVEQIRELTESLRYGPARDRYKVVVLDEVHRLSRNAFDALLKIVEEPPAHVVFVFATTEIEAVPATILSRCQEYHFRRVPPAVLAAHLREICTHENIAASDAALRMIARAGEGSVRDSVALLDQMATFGSSTIADQDAARLLGGTDTALFLAVLRALVAGDAQAVTRQTAEIEEQGWDPRQVFARFLAFCRDALHLALGGSPEALDLPADEAIALQALAREARYENLLRLLHLLLASEQVVRRSDAGVLALEIAWLRAAELPKLLQLEELLTGGAPATPGPPRRTEPAAPPMPRPTEPRPEATAPSAPPISAPRPTAVVAPAPPAPEAKAERSAPSGSAEDAFLEAVSKRKQALAAHLEDAQSLSFADGELKIFLQPGDEWLPAAMQRSTNRDILAEAVREVWGPAARWCLAAGAGVAPTVKLEALPAAETQQLAAHPMVQTMLEIFGGKVERISTIPPSPLEENDA
jgi:DNA polymerase-3 subunit gamma/tau